MQPSHATGAAVFGQGYSTPYATNGAKKENQTSPGSFAACRVQHAADGLAGAEAPRTHAAVVEAADDGRAVSAEHRAGRKTALSVAGSAQACSSREWRGRTGPNQPWKFRAYAQRACFVLPLSAQTSMEPGSPWHSVSCCSVCLQKILWGRPFCRSEAMTSLHRCFHRKFGLTPQDNELAILVSSSCTADLRVTRDGHEQKGLSGSLADWLPGCLAGFLNS